MAIHLRTLGDLRVVQDGTEVGALPGQPLRCSLLLYLAVEGRATREAVMGVLWPDRDPERARHSLSQTLYELRQHLGEGCIETKAEMLRRGSDVERVDAREFQEAAEAGDRGRALELYRGRFLEGAHLAPTREFESWTDRMRSRLHRMHRKVRSEHVAACLEEGRRADALAAARTWVELDALDDEAQHYLIRLLVESGRRSEALRQYERYRRLLARELDVEPLDQTRELVEGVRDGTVTASPPAPDEGAEPAEPTTSGEERATEAARTPERESVTPEDGVGERAPGDPGETSGTEEVGGASSAARAALEAGLPRVLIVYLVASFAVLQLVDILIDRLRLPDTFFGAALVLVVAGLPVVLTTAAIQAGVLWELVGAGSRPPGRVWKAVARWFSWRNAILAGLAGIAAWTGYALLFSPDEPVAPEAEVIAVLPFTVSGPGVQDFGKGIVSLLGPTLDGVGGIRTVNSRTVIHRWEERAGGGEPDFREALEIGREVGAGSVVLGSVVSLGDRVRLLAELHSVDGERLARAEAEGPLPEVLSLVDSLTVHLVRNVWRSRGPIPDLRVSAITTGSLPAMRAFLRGEELYRRSRWDSAGAAFRRAMELDSTFALAHFRFADAEIWGNQSFTRPALEAMDAAYRHRDRLPPRERTLVTARQLDLQGELAGVDTMRAFVERYPQDAEGWYYLGDVRFHARIVLALPPASLYRPFERSLQLLPTFSPALIHPLEWSVVQGDSARFHRYLERFRELSGGAEGGPYGLWDRIRWGPPDSVDVYLDRSLRQHSLLGSRPAIWAALFDPDVDPDEVLEPLARQEERIGSREPEWGFLRSLRLSLLAGLGRFDALESELQQVWESDPWLAVRLELRPVLGGLAPPGFASRAVAYLEERSPEPAAAYWLALRDLRVGDVEGARARIRDLRTRPDSLGALLDAVEGWASIAAGDTVEGVERIESGLRNYGYGSAPQPAALRYVWARTLASRSATRPDGVRRLRHGSPADEFLVPSRLVLARTLEEAGDPAGARDAYRSVLRLLDGADPEAARLRREARRALERLPPRS